MVTGLLLATLLAYAAPAHAGSPLPPQSPARSEVALCDAHRDGTGMAESAVEGATCGETGTIAGDVCCEAVHCTAMQSGLPAVAVDLSVPLADTTNAADTASIPAGIRTAPAPRPPSVTI